jgi:hypothetical protein
MPWLIQHKCSPADPEPVSYAIYKTTVDGQDISRVECPKCREQFFVLGHEMFGEAHTNEDARPLAGLPPGFVIARTRKPA